MDPSYTLVTGLWGLGSRKVGVLFRVEDGRTRLSRNNRTRLEKRPDSTSNTLIRTVYLNENIKL